MKGRMHGVKAFIDSVRQASMKMKLLAAIVSVITLAMLVGQVHLILSAFGVNLFAEKYYSYDQFVRARRQQLSVQGEPQPAGAFTQFGKPCERWVWINPDAGQWTGPGLNSTGEVLANDTLCLNRDGSFTRY